MTPAYCPLSVLASVLTWILAILIAAPATAARHKPAAAATTAQRESAWQAHQKLVENSLFQGLPWRSVGPVRQGGRVVDIEGVPGKPYTLYVAYASGGLWKTTNNGGSFEPLFDFEPTMIIGDVALDPHNPDIVWVGTGENNSSRSSYGGMGMFRSGDGGKTWERRGLLDADRIGRILVDPRDSNRVFVAVLGKLYTEGGTRGIYRSTDGGESWKRLLAGDNSRTGFIDLVIDPGNPDLLYAAAWERLRRPWDFSEGGTGSGIYKSSDGGETWTRLNGGFPRGATVGRIGLAIARNQPQTLYASLDNQQQLPQAQWDLGDGPLSINRLHSMTKKEFLQQDPESVETFVRRNDLDTSLDANKLIEMLKDNRLSMDQLRDELTDANANLFHANIHGLELWRSDDRGTTWRRTHEQPLRDVVHTYGYYFGQIAVDPEDSEHVYLAGVPLITSRDGGKTFESAQGVNVHGDYHPLWIDPRQPQHVVVGNDGGVDASYDAGKTWTSLDNQPVGQFYAITLDNEKPYNIYGGLQDNGSLKGSSRTKWRQGQQWQVVGGGDGMYAQIDPRDNKTLYTGFQFGFYKRRDSAVAEHSDDVAGPKNGSDVRPRDKIKQAALRYNWTTPIQLSPHNPDIIYFGANKLIRSMDRGDTWTTISPDLTRSRNRGDVPFATITTVAESPLTFGLIWVGSDDGHVHVTEDGGVNWREVSNGLVRDRWVSRVEPSHQVRGRIYVALNGYRDDDISAYLYRSDDLGAHWQSIAKGLPAEAINVVREDPVNADVVYVGTDRGVYVSLDRGASWQALQAQLPNVPVHDLAVQRRARELVAATHGRSVWVVDVLPVQEWRRVKDEAVHLFPLEAVNYQRSWQARRSPWFSHPQFYPQIKVPFWVRSAGRAELALLDSDKRVLRRMQMPTTTGVNSFTWDLLLDPQLAVSAEQAKRAAEKGNEKANTPPADDDKSSARRTRTPWGQAVALHWPLYITPGSYTMRINSGDSSAETELMVNPPKPRDPRLQPAEPIRGAKVANHKEAALINHSSR